MPRSLLLRVIPLVAKGYNYSGYMSIPIVVTPILFKGITRIQRRQG
ncbi:hypothetical protein [Alkaliphilus crotonatoxidans]